MFGRQIIRLKLPKGERSGILKFCNPKALRFMSQYESSDSTKDQKPPPSLKEWRPRYDTTHKLATKLKIFDRGGRPSTDMIVVMNAPWDLSRSGIKKWWAKKKRELDIEDQRFIKQRHEILGSNLAAAHFLVHRGAKVKFVDHEDWVVKDEDGEYELPTKYEPNYLIQAIDSNGFNLYYEGLMNLRYLYDLKYVSLKGSKTIDDWCMDRISSLFPRLEHLDISDCVNVSERGLEALYRMQTLKTLVVTNHHASPAFELTCMMLEDCHPNVKCDVRSPEPESKGKEKSET